MPSSKRSVQEVWLVIHEKLPRYCHYLHQVPYDEAIETVNSVVVSAHASYEAAEAAAKEYFFETLGFETDSGESEEGGFHYSASDNGKDNNAWDEHVFVDSKQVQK